MSPGSNPSSPGRKVDFTPTRLATINSEAPPEEEEEGAPTGLWDTETDHILSYFLSGAEGQAPSGVSASADFASTTTSSSTEPLSSLEQQQQQDAAASWQMPPPTPAVQFYAHSQQSSNSGGSPAQNHRSGGTTAGATGRSPQQQQHAPQPWTSSSQHSSSSSLSSMAAALVSGTGPGMLQYQRAFAGSGGQAAAAAAHLFPGGGNHQHGGGESPITPTAMIGNGYENLMLPTSNEQVEDTVRRSTVYNAMGPPKSRDPTWPTPGGGGGDNFIAPKAMMAPLLPQPPVPRHAASLAQAMGPVPPGSAGGAGGAGASTTTTTATSAQHRQQLMYAAAARAASLHNHQPAVETKEKRAKRLERNRESARKSRRRKKERLASLGAQVSQLHHDIEVARCQHINIMVPALAKSRYNELMRLPQTNDNAPGKLGEIIRASGPSSNIMRAVLDFQYTQLKQLTLPSYQKMLLWLTLRNEKYFYAGKEQYALTATDGRATGKVSSKQIGDELLNGPGKQKNKASKSKRGDNEDDSKPNPSSAALDAARTWPLFCFELKFSVDQEERLLHAHKQLLHLPDLARKRSQMATAVSTAESFGKAVGSLSHVIAKREEKTLVGILEPRQVVAYQAWLHREGNRARIRRVPEAKQQPVAAAAAGVVSESPASSTAVGGDDTNKEASLADICRRLNEVLQISTKSERSNSMSEDY